jgi:hypothetical protein
MRVEIQTTPALRAAVPESLFKHAHGTTWDVAPDGKHFLVELVPAADVGQKPPPTPSETLLAEIRDILKTKA